MKLKLAKYPTTSPGADLKISLYEKLKTLICLFETITPLGKPVVPEVKKIAKRSSGLTIMSTETSRFRFKSSI